MDSAPDVDIIVALAGIGFMMHNFAKERCERRSYGLLEEGHNFEDFEKNDLAFCEGLRGR